MPSDDPLMRPEEVAELFGVDTRTIARWADEGKLCSVRTLGGHRRFRRSEVERLLDDN
ncbi:BldC family transcriptional regulator [Streptomyces sp. NPDC057854]|uniref:BldC family transcriptional regulator n=1 Tax=unclassified Streptomyces TaxID=2593676 RepID=UPI003694F6FF